MQRLPRVTPGQNINRNDAKRKVAKTKNRVSCGEQTQTHKGKVNVTTNTNEMNDALSIPDETLITLHDCTITLIGPC